ncbi:MAG: tetratricopeptide repeat protein [Gemmatimonadales bacterium]|jgi:Flp pilus assembly protein TadD|nr:MAG: tetratricopeptide repeat protein [Gemmatimonadales bacterium]
MPERFLSSEEYDEQAHELYNKGDYDGALEMLKEGLSLYPNAVELYIGMGYARLAREEFAWARRAFERAAVLDPGHEDALVGLGEILLRFGDHGTALKLFQRVQQLGFDEDVELMLTMGRALYREQLYADARDIFSRSATTRPESAEVAAALGYTLHRLGDEVGAGRQVRRALRLDPDLHEARTYLGHLLYDRGDWEGALREFERVPPMEHWDPVAVWRIMELKRALWHMESGDARLAPWEARLRELESMDDPIDRLLAEVEAGAVGEGSLDLDPSQLELFESGSAADSGQIQVRTQDGTVYWGSWLAVVRQMRDGAGFGHEPLVHYMRRLAERWHEVSGVEIPFQDPESFIRSAARARLIVLEELNGGSEGEVR